MCDICASDEILLAVHEAREFLDSLLDDYLLTPVEKGLDLGTRRGFDRAVAMFAAELGRISGDADASAVREVAGVIDIDWRDTTPEQRRKLIARAVRAAGKVLAPIVTMIKVPFARTAESVVAATRRDSRQRQRLAISADFNAIDQRIIQHVARSQGNFVRDEYGRRLEGFSKKARAVVAAGLEEGIASSDIVHDLELASYDYLVGCSHGYWNLVASSFVGQGRAFAQVSSYVEAGVETYVVEAVLDEVTTPVCRFLHGKTFSVSQALARFDAVEQMDKPEDIKRVMPWVREGLDKETAQSVLYVNGTDGRIALAEVRRSGIGNRDDRGEFRAIMSDEALGAAGVCLPPLHGHCRSTIIPA
ncbi:MAG: head morphogenesis protein [Myxococcales bacterium]